MVRIRAGRRVGSQTSFGGGSVEAKAHNIRNFAMLLALALAGMKIKTGSWTLLSIPSVVSECCSESLRLRPVFQSSTKLQRIYNGVPSPLPVKQRGDV